MACLANFGVAGTAFGWEDIPVFPGDGPRGNEAVSVWAERFGADIVIWLHDAWVLKPRQWSELAVAVWAPVDHYPVPPQVYATLREPNVQPIAMSRFGAEWMKRLKLDPLYVPHGVDTQLFRPQPEIKEGVRESIGIPKDAFLVGMVAANAAPGEFPRKGYAQAFSAFARFLERHDDAWLYAHTRPVDGMNLESLMIVLNDLSSKPGLIMERIKFPPHGTWYLGLPRDQMADLFCSFDVLLNPSMGEGFGIPIIEAQACGIPVIASDHSAMTEITKAGWLVKGDPWWDVAQDSFGFTPSIGDIERALEAAYESRGDVELAASAREHALAYDADLVTVHYWEPTLKALEHPKEIGPLKTDGNRAQRRAAQRKKVKT